MKRREIMTSLLELMQCPEFVAWRPASQVELLLREIDQINHHQLFLKRLSQWQLVLVERPVQGCKGCYHQKEDTQAYWKPPLLTETLEETWQPGQFHQE
jgi:hypothetical protein